jgi:hypothetical protein
VQFRSVVDRAAKSVEHPTEHILSNPDAGGCTPGYYQVTQLHSFNFFEGHGENKPIAKADHLGADPTSCGGANLTKIANSRGWAPGLNQKAGNLYHFASKTKRLELV